ncbi:hypothetical protein BDK92_5684 [Micromonospora pisi]|uniref:Uncharacterized protein n=1 Tax=Micromonospora pisi TaxID=589240 RepID=A0A495JR29_9ACTN|nr:hypothetical protein [Micromonospora pisi]RKR91291.1 hypothetical protein BDK92_5684 [Micromonospora pisi]
MANREREPETTTDSDTLATAPRGLTPDLPVGPDDRHRVRNRGRFDTPTPPEPLEFFSIGVSGRIRRNPTA